MNSNPWTASMWSFPSIDFVYPSPADQTNVRPFQVNLTQTTGALRSAITFVLPFGNF